MFKKFLVPLLILSMVFFYECKDDHILPDQDQTALKKGKGGGGSGGGGHNGGSGGLYGDLVICLRTADGIPIYVTPEDAEHEDVYPQPIMVEVATLIPAKDGDTYMVFELNSEGEPIISNDDYMVKEVEFGRLNIVRAPQSVLDRALNEAMNGLKLGGLNDVIITTDASGRLVRIIGEADWIVNFDDDLTNDEFDDKTIDSPIENIAIYQELIGNGFQGVLVFVKNNFHVPAMVPDPENVGEMMKGFLPSEIDPLVLAYSALAAGADKTGNMIVDELAYMNDWLIKWEDPLVVQVPDKSPDEKGRQYYDFSDFTYDRGEIYDDKYVRVTEFVGQTWKYEYYSLNDISLDIWTDSELLIDYENGANTGITGYCNAIDDAIQVLEYLHSSDLIVYDPYYTPPVP